MLFHGFCGVGWSLFTFELVFSDFNSQVGNENLGKHSLRDNG